MSEEKYESIVSLEKELYDDGYVNGYSDGEFDGICQFKELLLYKIKAELITCKNKGDFRRIIFESFKELTEGRA